MTLRHFKIYVTVYNEKNMTLAAKKLFMAQPSVSQVIKELETHYNTVLFERFPKELYEITKQIPFGCHAWKKYQFEEFWKQYIELSNKK